ncbi:MAG TPA: acetylxylan esterase [Kofleriaceae bacterium]|nr:acetylxylan esterase [Kofleriaceae bacterium]
MKRTILIATLLLTAHRASADCAVNVSGAVKKYWPSSGTTSYAGDPRCDQNGASCHLSGWLYTPSTSGAHPAIVYSTNAPHEGARFDTCEVVNYFVPKGYVVFVPYARGTDDVSNHVASLPGEGFHNTGVNHLDAGPNSIDTLYALWDEEYDLQLAVQYVQGLSSVDATKVAVFGAGDGGTRAALLAEEIFTSTPQPKVTINLSGAVWVWSSDPQWATDLDGAAEYHQGAVLYQSVGNESSSGDYTATISQFTYAGRYSASRPAKLALYAPFTVSTSAQSICTNKGYNTNRCASYTFLTDGGQVPRWIDTVHKFLIQYGVQ